MTSGTDEETSMLSPDEAFAMLGNETRMGILQTLSEADEPVAFDELRQRLGTPDADQLTYHLSKLTEHFIKDIDDGYVLHAAGKRVIESVVSGAVTDAPVVEPTRLDAPCPYCGAPIDVDYRDEHLLTRCTACPGTFAGVESASRPDWTDPHGTIALFPLPPAGFRDRTLREALDAACAWLIFQSHSRGMCPRCSAPLDRTVDVCESHIPDDEICERCNRRFAVMVRQDCPNCPFMLGHLGPGSVLAEPEVGCSSSAGGSTSRRQRGTT